MTAQTDTELDVVEAFTDVCEAATHVDAGLGADSGFSEACFQTALAAELPTSQREVVRPCRTFATSSEVHHGRPRPLRSRVPEPRRRNQVVPHQMQISLPPALHAQLSAYKRLLAPNEILLAVLFWKNGVDVFEYK